MNVFIIINEWIDIEDNTSSEVTGAKYFESEDDAHDHLADIATSHGQGLELDETALVIEDLSAHLRYEEYYIQELTRG